MKKTVLILLLLSLSINVFATNFSISAGGGGLLRGLDKLLSEETGLPVHVAEDPLSAVAEGTGRALQEIKFLRQVAAADRTYRA